LKLANWKGNHNYWTSGTQKGSKGQWWWCKQDGSATSFSTDLIWEKGQPDNKGGNEDCTHLRFIMNTTGTILSDRNCTSKYIFACEVSKLQNYKHKNNPFIF